MPAFQFTSYTVSTAPAVAPFDDGSWTRQPHLICETLTQGLAPTLSQATLMWRFGTMKRTAGSPPTDVDDAMAYIPPLDLMGQYVLIEFIAEGGAEHWIGRVLEPSTQRWAQETIPAGEEHAGEQRVKAGDRTYIALGLEYFLGRVQVAGTSSREADKNRRPYAYNAGAGDGREQTIAQRANRQPPTDAGVDPYDPLAFSLADDAIEWNAAAAIKHVLREYCPRNGTDDPSPIRYNLAASALPFLTTFKPLVRVETHTVLEILDEVISRRRGLTWWLSVGPFEDPLEDPDNDINAIIHVSSVALDDIELPDDETLLKALTQETFDPGAYEMLLLPVIARGGRKRYNRFRVRGARRTCTASYIGPDIAGDEQHVFPIDIHSATAKGWTASQQTEFLTGVRPTLDGPNQAAYDALNDRDQAAWNDRYRNLEKFHRVYRYLQLVPISATGFELSPLIEQGTGSIVGDILTEVFDTQKLAFRVLRQMPLFVGVDYTDARSPDDSAVADDQRFEHMQPLVFAYMMRSVEGRLITMGADTYEGSIPSATADGGWRLGHLVGANLERSKNGDEDVREDRFTFNINLAPVIGFNGVAVTVPGGAPIMLRYKVTDEGDPETGPTAHKDVGVIWFDLLITATVEYDAYCEAVWPVIVPTQEPVEELLIQLPGDRARFDWIVKGTAFDLDKHGHVRQVEHAAAIRDDTKYCETVARFAHQWYSVDRAEVVLHFKNTSNPLALGTLVTDIGTDEAAETVNAVVSQIVHRLEEGGTTITLGFPETEFGAFR